ncbi:translocating chain-associated membrane protein 1-like 1 [Planococcus citri]|uniref:translocating chain-associated membrane protein 1-like 1 n=1 Tax=Planococcus citri TaxID=170843 RepID=UPI0031F7682A
MPVKPRKTPKKPPILSHEFVIQNHADIISCVMVLFVFGIIVPITSSVCYTFVAAQYANEIAPRVVAYGTGVKDLCTIFFYTLVCIILHAVLQEYVLDKISKKLHLSKIKTSMFNESGQLLVFCLISIVWAGDLIIKDDLLLNIRTIWQDYPHLNMPFMLKFFFIIQISYWIHCFPELYLSKAKREEIPAKVKLATINLIYVSALYFLNFNRVGILLMFLHYLSDGFYHFAILFDIVDKEEKNSKISSLVSDIVFALSRISTIVLSLVTFVFGLSSTEKPAEEVQDGDYNTLPIRLSAFGLISALQVYRFLFFFRNHVSQLKEIKLPIGSLLKQQQQQTSSETELEDEPKYTKRQNRKKESHLPEVDQNLKRTTRSKKLKAK